MRIPRRTILKAGLALPSLSWTYPVLRISSRNDSSFDPWIEVHRENLRHNVGEVSKKVKGRPILAVVKNNGYGLGVQNVAHILEPLDPIAGFAVVKLHEALLLREVGVKKAILLMGPFDGRDLEEMVAQKITPMVYTPLGKTLDAMSDKFQKPISIQICVDTGIGRVGVPHAKAAELIRDLAGRRSVRIDGIMMTFTEDQEFDEEQLSRFQSLCNGLTETGIKLGKQHAASSFGLFQRPDGFLDMVRPGMVLFGIYPEKEFSEMGLMQLRPSVSLKTRVIYVKQLHRGDSAGYGRQYKAQCDTWVATLPVGHADGFPRVAAKGARVRIDGNLYPVVALSASHSVVEIGPEPSVGIGDVATLFDWQEGSRPEDVASACGASVYDLTMHLNPLLPRRVL
jgi:alanine racemase